jgi:predicted nucleic acid-binding protein
MKSFTEYLTEKRAKTKVVSMDASGKRKLMKSFKQFLDQNDEIDKVVLHTVISRDK